MGVDAAREVAGPVVDELRLGEHRIRVDVDEARPVVVALRMLERARDIDQEVGGGEDFRPPAIGEPVPAIPDRKPVHPAVSKAEPFHDLGQVLHVRRRVVRDQARTGVSVDDVGPLARVLEVVHVVAEIGEPEGILYVVPADAPEPGVLGDQAGDDDAEAVGHRRALRAKRSPACGGRIASSRSRLQCITLLVRACQPSACFHAARGRGEARVAPRCSSGVGDRRLGRTIGAVQRG